MSGHSKWATIKRAKGVTDAKRGALFTRIGNQVAIAARSGADPAMNPSLAMAIEKAKAANMPMVNIERAIKRVTDKAAAALHEVLYEGYGPAGAAVLVECATDNINRTYPEIRLIFGKTGGNIAEMGAVAFQFKHRGMIKIAGSGDDLMLEVLDAGAEDVVEETAGELIVYTELKDLGKVRDALKAAGHKVLEAELIYDPQNKIEISDESSAEKVMKLLDALEEHQDVVNVYSNFEMV